MGQGELTAREIHLGKAAWAFNRLMHYIPTAMTPTRDPAAAQKYERILKEEPPTNPGAVQSDGQRPERTSGEPGQLSFVLCCPVAK